MSEFRDRVALITGASRGIGRAIAEVLAEGGATVALNYAANDVAAKEAEAACQKMGAKTLLLKFDVADAAACAAAVDQVVATFGRIDFLVNNAGVAIDQLALRVKEEDWQRQIAVNLTGAFMLCKAAARPMLKARSGCIVNVVSVVGEMGNPGQSAYVSSKAGLIGLTKALARELGSRSVRVNAVSPGFIETEMTAGLSEEARTRLTASLPLTRLGSAREVANCVAFLLSDKASYVTGEVLKVNGGMYM